LINEAVDLFDVPLPRRRTVEEGDLVATLRERVERLVERHRATRRAVDELGGALVERDRRIVELDAKLAGFERLRADLLGRIDALVVEVDRLASAGDDRAA
jgi:phage terminase large subunit-like protein